MKKRKQKKQAMLRARAGAKYIQKGCKLFLSILLSLVVVVSQTQVFSAFESGVINVTATFKDRCEAGYSISGVKFNDKNGNQIQDSGEEGLAGWIIVLNKGPYEEKYDFDNSGYVNISDKEILRNIFENNLLCPAGKDCDFDDDFDLDSDDVTGLRDYVNARDLGSKITSPDGSYAFLGLAEGAYVIYEVPQNEWQSTTQQIRYINDILCGGERVDFGNNQRPREPYCGDGIVQSDRGEECDDGNTQDGDGCSSQCANEICPGNIILDFEKDASGNPILKGQVIDDEYSLWGINIHAHNYNAGHPQKAIIFDSDEPSGGINGDQIIDIDLGTPNKMFGGPGDSETGDGSEPSNNRALHNLLILPDNDVDTSPADGFIDDPNDEPAGGSLRFVFDMPFTFESVTYIDLDHNSGEVVGYSDVGGTAQVFSIPVAHAGGNSVLTARGDKTTQIRFLKTRGRDSHAIDEVSLCPVLSCGNGVVDAGEECDDGNRVNNDGCENSCKTTNFCGDGVVQNPNSFNQRELCDDGVLNGTDASQCTPQCAPKAGQCNALSQGYYKNNDGCANGTGASIWADEVNVISDSFFDVFVTITGEEMCVALADNCASGTDIDKSRCKAQKHLLADESDIAASRLRLDALLAGVDDGNTAFDSLGLSATSTVSQALNAVEQIISDANSPKAQLDRAQYVAMRVYTWYEDENPVRPECVLPGLGNGVLETGEECDDGNLIPWDGCSAEGKREVVLNEILPDPAGSDNAPKPNGEWVELFNLTNKPISLENWALYDSIDTHELLITTLNTDTGTTTIEAASHLVVYRNGDSDFSLNNTGDSVRLYTKTISQNGKLIDSFIYTGGKGEGNTFARVPDGTGDWVDPCPTPGDENNEKTCAEDEEIDPLETPEQINAEQNVFDEDPPDIIVPAPDAASFTQEEWAAIESYLLLLEERESGISSDTTPSAAENNITATTTEEIQETSDQTETQNTETQTADTQTTQTETMTDGSSDTQTSETETSESEAADGTQVPATKDEETAETIQPENATNGG